MPSRWSDRRVIWLSPGAIVRLDETPVPPAGVSSFGGRPFGSSAQNHTTDSSRPPLLSRQKPVPTAAVGTGFRRCSEKR